MTLVIDRIAGLASVQDLGRRGHMHASIPPGGALVRSLLIAANRLAGNADDAPALEIFGRVTVRAESELVVATDRAITLRAGEALEVISEPARVAYLALRGGIDVPALFGAHGALVSCGLGPISRVGDIVRPAGRTASGLSEVTKWERERVHVCVIAGPDSDAIASGTLDGRYRVLSASDRVGTRLAGPAIPWVAGYKTRSRPMVRGAIELPPDGQPIVLGPEHPTVGGHPIIGVIADADQDRFFATRIGGEVTLSTRS